MIVAAQLAAAHFKWVGRRTPTMARKWATSTVRISYRHNILCIEDDGPGVPDFLLAEIATRGFRLDCKRPGKGLGLAIVAELAESYALTVKYQRSSLGA